MAFFALFLALFVDGYQKRSVRFAAMSGLTSLPILARFPVRTAQYSIFIAAFCIVYLILVNIWSDRRTTKFSAKFGIVTGITSLFVNMYLFVPIMVNLPTYSST